MRFASQETDNNVIYFLVVTAGWVDALLHQVVDPKILL